MAVDWYLMDQPPIYNGGFEGEEFFAYAQDGFKEMLDTTMLCDNVEFINSDFSVITPGKAIIQSVTPDTQLKAEDRQILVPIGTLQTYSYIRFEDEILNQVITNFMKRQFLKFVTISYDGKIQKPRRYMNIGIGVKM